MKSIEGAIRAYEGVLAQDDRDRLKFFEALWRVLDEQAEPKDVACRTWTLAKQDAARAAREGMPLLRVKPAVVSADFLASTAEAIVASIRAQATYPDGVMRELESVAFRDVIEAADATDAGACPEEFLAAFADALCEKGAPQRCVRLAASIVSLALRQALERQAAEAFSVLEQAGVSEEHFLRCPVCGGEPVLSHVGAPTSSSGRGRRLVCSQCGTSWEFDRIRCARCGTRDQQKLHQYSIEGDDAHRLAVCDECGGSIKTLYSDDMLAACSYEVEDVVMAKLEAAVRAGAAS